MQLPRLLTFEQFAGCHPAFSVRRLQRLRFSSKPVTRKLRGRVTGKGKKRQREEVVRELPANGFDSAFLRVAGRVLVDETEFFAVIARQNGRGGEGLP